MYYKQNIETQTTQKRFISFCFFRPVPGLEGGWALADHGPPSSPPSFIISSPQSQPQARHLGTQLTFLASVIVPQP